MIVEHQFNGQPGARPGIPLVIAMNRGNDFTAAVGGRSAALEPVIGTRPAPRTTHVIDGGSLQIPSICDSDHAGDYDGDGRSEVIFFESGYNRDGYILLDLRDASKAEFWWSYH